MRNLSHPRFTTFALGCVLVALSGCATSFRPAPEGTPPAARIDLAARVAPVALAIESVIVTDGPGSWREEARWDEYVVRIANTGGEIIVIDEALLTDALGDAQQAGVDPWRLEVITGENGARYARAGIYIVGGGAAGYGLMTGIFLSGTVSAGMVLVPGALIGTTVTIAAKNRHNRARVEREFHNRTLRLPFMLGPGMTAAGSLFFPVVPAPRRLTVRALLGDSPRDVVIDLGSLATIHAAVAAVERPR